MKRIIVTALAVLCLTGTARADDKASLRLNWLAYGFHSPFYLGVARGLYKQQGIELEIGEGQGSGRAVQAVAAGSDTFGLADGTAIVAGVARGVPVQAVMGIMNSGPNGIIVPKASGVTDLKGLAGATIAATTGEASLVLLPAVLRAQKLPADHLRALRVDGAAKLVAVLEKRAAGMLGGIENQAIILEQRGTPVTTLLFSELGANTLGLAILVTTEQAKKDPGLVRRFAAATRASYELAAKEPEAAIDALLAVKPTLDRALSMAQLQAGTLLMQSPNGRGKPVGTMSEEDWTGTIALMKEFQALETSLPASAFWTNEYLPQ